MRLIDLPALNAKRLEALQQNGIQSIEDLLNFFPRRYLDRTNVLPIRSVHGNGEEITVVGRVTQVQEAGYGRKKRLEVIIQDETASLKGVWFKGVRYFKKAFETGDLVAFFGKAKHYGRFVSMAHPDVDKLQEKDDVDKVARIMPIYPGNKQFSKTHVNSRLIRRWMDKLLRNTRPPEFLPAHYRKAHKLPERHRAYRMIHFPKEQSDYRDALRRFKYEELFLFQLSVARVKRMVREKHAGHLFKDMEPHTQRFFNGVLPFTLTEGQRGALSDIKKDVRSGHQMNRLVQGDVGAGKTVVAIGAMLMAIDNGYQAAFMAPTEILAEQHYRTLSEYLEPTGLNIRLLTGNQKAALREDVLTDIAGGRCQIVVGTHAIIQDKVGFHNLGLVVIDEQHRFGVMQRAELLEKGSHPHVLVMSATPIPRSLAMTLYSDLDISIVRGLPAGRKPVKTAVRTDKKREDVYHFVRQSLAEGGQAYIVYPLVEESEAVDLKDATVGYEKLQKRFPEYKVGLLHGRMKSEEKDAVMQGFINNEIQVLVTTTVIEVGVDVPNASIMVIEHAERFGLSQLHQLRGRIGRGERQSYCILIPGEKVSRDGRLRLKTMVETNDGFRIAEADLKLRGPGDFLGTKQSGLPDFRVADIVEDQDILRQAKHDAWELIDKDADLQAEDHAELRKVFLPYFKEKARFYGMG